jgi:hypothetical protein
MSHRHFIRSGLAAQIVFYRIFRRAMKGPQTPYPEWAVKAGDAD